MTTSSSRVRDVAIVLAALVAGSVGSIVVSAFRPEAPSAPPASGGLMTERAARADVPAAAPRTFPRAAMPPDVSDARQRAANAELERRDTAQLESFHARYENEPIDGTWAAGKETQMLQASISTPIQTAQVVPRNFTATCRSSTCALHAEFPNRGAATDWLTLFSAAMGGDMPNISFRFNMNPDGSVRLEGYGLGRK